MMLIKHTRQRVPAPIRALWWAALAACGAGLAAGGCSSCERDPQARQPVIPESDLEVGGPLLCSDFRWCRDPAFLESNGYLGAAVFDDQRVVVLAGERSLLWPVGQGYVQVELPLAGLNRVHAIWGVSFDRLWVGGDVIQAHRNFRWYQEWDGDGRRVRAMDGAGEELLAVGDDGLVLLRRNGRWTELTPPVKDDWRQVAAAKDTWVLIGREPRVAISQGGQWRLLDLAEAIERDRDLWPRPATAAAQGAEESSRPRGRRYGVPIAVFPRKQALEVITAEGAYYRYSSTGWDLLNQEQLENCRKKITPAEQCPAGEIVAAAPVGNLGIVLGEVAGENNFHAWRCDSRICSLLPVVPDAPVKFFDTRNEKAGLLAGLSVGLIPAAPAAPAPDWLASISTRHRPVDFIGAREMAASQTLIAARDGRTWLFNGRNIRPAGGPLADKIGIDALVQLLDGTVFAVGERVYRWQDGGWRKMRIEPPLPEEKAPVLFPFRGHRSRGLIALANYRDFLWYDPRQPEVLWRKPLAAEAPQGLPSIMAPLGGGFRVRAVTQSAAGVAYVLTDAWEGFYRGVGVTAVVSIADGKYTLNRWPAEQIFQGVDGQIYGFRGAQVYVEKKQAWVPLRKGLADFGACWARSEEDLYCLDQQSRIWRFSGERWSLEDPGGGYDRIAPYWAEISADEQRRLYLVSRYGALRIKVNQ